MAEDGEKSLENNHDTNLYCEAGFCHLLHIGKLFFPRKKEL